MFNVTFIVFVNGFRTDQERDIINNLTSCGFAPLVDSKHRNQKQWFMNNCVDLHLLFLPNGKSYVFDTSNPNYAPILGVFFNHGNIGEMKDCKLMENWVLKNVFKTDYDTTLPIDEFDKFIERPEKPQNLLSDEKVLPEPTDEKYQFIFEYLENDDCMLYQVIKPFTDKPYTTITRHFSQKGHLPFFSSLFICNSWGVCNKDIIFLKKLWDHLKMEGPFDINDIVDKRIEACTPGAGKYPEPEPEVWRNNLNAVKKILHERKTGFIPLE